jgi:transglutaminase-like putative cysteine protease
VGELKLGERIVLRVRPDPPPREPLLLRTASYDRYHEGTWLATRSPFEPLSLEAGAWSLPGTGAGGRSVTVAEALDEGRGMLSLPGGARRVEGLEGARLSRNAFAAVKVLEGPGLARYRVEFGGPFADAPPGPADLRIPRAEGEALERVLDSQGWRGAAPSAALERLRAWFEGEFRYSLDLAAAPRGAGRTALGHFLWQRRAGHCEYFASAATLLLRGLGIPARYARGWSVQEYSPLEEAHLVRSRHAHAWTLAWVEGAWRDFDPTPPGWADWEADRRPWWAGLHDRWQWLGYRWATREGGAGGTG